MLRARVHECRPPEPFRSQSNILIYGLHLSVLTTIGFDDQKFLGQDLASYTKITFMRPRNDQTSSATRHPRLVKSPLMKTTKTAAYLTKVSHIDLQMTVKKTVPCCRREKFGPPTARQQSYCYPEEKDKNGDQTQFYSGPCHKVECDYRHDQQCCRHQHTDEGTQSLDLFFSELVYRAPRARIILMSLRMVMVN